MEAGDRGPCRGEEGKGAILSTYLWCCLGSCGSQIMSRRADTGFCTTRPEMKHTFRVTSKKQDMYAWTFQSSDQQGLHLILRVAIGKDDAKVWAS